MANVSSKSLAPSPESGSLESEGLFDHVKTGGMETDNVGSGGDEPELSGAHFFRPGGKCTEIDVLRSGECGLETDGALLSIVDRPESICDSISKLDIWVSFCIASVERFKFSITSGGTHWPIEIKFGSSYQVVQIQLVQRQV